MLMGLTCPLPHTLLRVPLPPTRSHAPPFLTQLLMLPTPALSSPFIFVKAFSCLGRSTKRKASAWSLFDGGLGGVKCGRGINLCLLISVVAVDSAVPILWMAIKC